MTDIVERLEKWITERYAGAHNNWGEELGCDLSDASHTIKALRYDHARDAEKIAALSAAVAIRDLKIEQLQGYLVKAADKIADYDGRSPELID